MHLTVQNHTTEETLLAAELGDDDAMIGIDWIKLHNPEIDWKAGTLKFTRCPEDCQNKKVRTAHRHPKPETKPPKKK
jgi:hypothetical protein